MKHEQIFPNEHFPFKMFSFESKNPARLIATHWHKSAELLYCMSGSLEVRFPQRPLCL